MTEDFGGVTMSDEDSEEDTQLHSYQCRQPTELQVNGGDMVLLRVGGVYWSKVILNGILGAVRSLLACMTSSRTQGEGSSLAGGVGNLGLLHSLDGIFS